jgi:hypothetical protein
LKKTQKINKNNRLINKKIIIIKVRKIKKIAKVKVKKIRKIQKRVLKMFKLNL